MVNGLKGINKIVGMAKGIARQSSRALPVILPAVTIFANIADIAATSGGDLAAGSNEFVKRYTFIDIAAGKFDASAGAKGAGSLIASGFVGLLLSALT